MAGGFEVETRYWVVRLHAAPTMGSPVTVVSLWGVWLVLPDAAWRECVGGVGVGLFLENCIVDASIL